jgi:heterodisulfide reductase subunit A
MKRVGVYICHCGTNIAGKVDVTRIAEQLGEECEEVVISRHYKYMCSEPGQKMIRDDIAELGLDHVVEASCSPKMHEPTFRNAVSMAGMNQYMFEMVNIREHCSWVSDNGELATDKAKCLVKGAIARVVHHHPLQGSRCGVNRSALVVGGGIAGITAALKIATAGYKVYLVEKDEIIGGRMAQFDKTFPTLDCAGCTLTPKTSEAGRHPNIEILTKSEVVDVTGFVGNFSVRVLQKPRYVRTDKCTGCGDCQKVCPVNVSSSFEVGLATRHPISRPFPQAIPNTYSIVRLGKPPCQAACPAGVNAQGYMTLAAEGKFDQALALVRQRMPFASICGRICNRLCESACKRGQVDEPLAICHTKRFLGDWESTNKPDNLPAVKPRREEKIAVIGGGPGGLSAAYYLSLEGYSVTIFEKLPLAGGMLAVGIPEYRLPKSVLDREIGRLTALGVEIRTGIEIGKDLSLNQLRQDGYRAFFLGIGAHKGYGLGIKGEKEFQPVVDGVTFLRDLGLGNRKAPADRVVVIGGGNVAIDAARSALRLGCSKVSIAYRRTRLEMPANEEEIHHAEQEGIEIHYLTIPKRVVGVDGRVTGLECIRAQLGEPDAGGRRRPVPIEGSEFIIEVDAVIPAIGQEPDLGGLCAEDPFEISRRGTFVVDKDTFQTKVADVFAGGDAVLGPATFVEAVAHGRLASVAIHDYLRHGSLREVKAPEKPVEKELSEEERARSRPIERQRMPILSSETRTRSFDEVELGLSPEQVQLEGKRCLSCGLCCQCGECASNCGPQAIDLTERDRIRSLDVGAIVVATGIDIFDARRFPEYGYGRYPDVITNLQFERLCNASGPTGGRLVRPSDGKTPQSVVFIQCVGSRDRARGAEYCSKVCCMISAKQLSIFKHFNHEGQAYVFYIDNRTGGKGYEEFLRRAIEEENAQYIRGRVAKVFQEGGRLKVRGENSLAGGPVEIEADMVVLATGLTARNDYINVARALNLATDKHGFFIELHPKLGPVETSLSGVYLAGAAQGPKDIPESVAQGGAAAAEALALFSVGQVEVEPTVATVLAARCTGCRTCEGLCAYQAISFSEEEKHAVINQAMCQGCGTCAAACPVAAIAVNHYTPDQIFAQIEGILG